jgi:hypothetical protein
MVDVLPSTCYYENDYCIHFILLLLAIVCVTAGFIKSSVPLFSEDIIKHL